MKVAEWLNLQAPLRAGVFENHKTDHLFIIDSRSLGYRPLVNVKETYLDSPIGC